jgi:hypothetical protein
MMRRDAAPMTGLWPREQPAIICVEMGSISAQAGQFLTFSATCGHRVT